MTESGLPSLVFQYSIFERRKQETVCDVTDRDLKATIMARLKNYAFLSFLIFRVFGFVIARQAALARKELPDLYEASVLELQNGLDQRLFSSVDLVKVGVTEPTQS